jgi:myosin heavy subunit
MAKIVDTGTTVAFYSPDHAWVIGSVTAYDVKNKTYTCTSKEPAVVMDRLPGTADKLWAPRVEYLEEDVHDLLQLTELHEASLLFCLKRRYLRNIVYTNIGPIVVALNPFNYEIPWYKDDKMHEYLSEGVVIERNLPHSWAVAHNTFWEMRENKQNQTVLISGESGAGKTEAAKIVAKYLGAVSTLTGTDAQKDAMQAVNKKILASSPILESFGNAKTVRNDNSSRFGKFAKMQFDRDGFLVGCHVTKYLLEKSRIITSSQNERVYHSFYQLAQGEAGKKFGIRNVKIYKALCAGGCTSIEGVDDAQDFLATQQAMMDVGIDDEERNSIFRIVAGILYLQNLEFTETEERTGKVARIDANLHTAVTRASELWEVSEERLVAELTSNTIVTRNEVTVKLLNKVQAQDMRDSVSKSTYDWLFNWLVEKINRTTDVEQKCQQWIGLLDIFGFEDFKVNSFEQLCINSANENLQNHYNWHIFTEDMRECKEEGIDTTAVQFVDNKGCLDLLMVKNGIFSLLDEECARSGTEKNFLAVLNEKFGGTKQKAGDPYFGQALGKAMDNCFKIKHYAAEVQYVVDGFMDKNRDTLKENMKRVLKDSNNAFMAALVPALEDPSARPAAKLTVSGYFIRQLQELMSVITATNPHWIRCIKPHPNKLPLHFHGSGVMSQLRSAGVLDTVKVRKAGYPIRFPNELFLRRYAILLTHNGVAPDAPARAKIEFIFKSQSIERNIGQLGKTKVFLRQEAFSKLNHAKDEATLEYSLMWQSVGRASLVRASLFGAYVQLHRARILEEKRQREEALRQQREAEERRRRAEEEERERQERLMKQQKYRSAVMIQKHVRGMIARITVVRHYLEMCRARDEYLCDTELQKMRQFGAVDRRVKLLEDRHFEKVKMTEKLHHNKGESTSIQMRRKQLVESRENVHQRNEEQMKTVILQRKRDIEADKGRRKEAISTAALKKAEEEARAAERRRAAKAAREAAEERALADWQQDVAQADVRKLKKAMQQEETEVLFRLHHQRQFPTQRDGGIAGAFEAARAEFARQEWWADAREGRFQELIEHNRTVQRPSGSASIVSPRPAIINPAAVLSPAERRLEAAHRERLLEDVVSRVYAGRR